MSKQYKLCYVDDNILYFTDDFKHCWGDDFDDPRNRKSYEYFCGLVAGLADHRKFDIILDRAKKRMEEEEVNERVKAYKELEETRNIFRAYADEIRRKLVDEK